ncbi:hypothetical protein dqs_2788 [Azoarcus olearius]|uniref:hypothetical protein n=1 Tax=Azoarcus sp. (strain BH72) TaxID=418699 RepID=UPI0008063634|nr:hypothetical protein [Azoarcus olearius]ANQ85817.1 hypothetical protein dqs_2788 [Azoarcus olearius]
MWIESGFAQIAQLLLWPVLLLVGAGFVYSLWLLGGLGMEAFQRSRGFVQLHNDAKFSMDEIELQVMRRLEPTRLLSRISPLLGLIATMVPLGPALQSVAAGEGQQALAVFSGAFAGVVLALAAAAIGLVVYSVRRRWLLTELVALRRARGLLS